MDLVKLSKEELKEIASDSDVWSIYIRMKEMLGKIKGVDFNEEWETESRFNQIPTGFSLDVEYTDAAGKLSKLSLKQTGNAPESISTHVNLVVQLAKLTNRTIEEVNKENYLANKKLIKKLDRVVYLGREYLKVYKEAYSGIPPQWLDDNIGKLKWIPNANLRVLAMLKAAKKMEKALGGVKEHLMIGPFEEATMGGKSVVNLTFNRLNDGIDLVTRDENAQMLANLILSPISIYLKEECPDLPEKDRRRIQQSRVAVLALMQIRPPQTEAFEAVNRAVLAVMMA
nr:MAG TPA: hypothetical protein [Caudoviricetes sp.]